MAFQSPPFAPYATTNAAGQFSTLSDGFIQGTAQDDPVARFYLATGVVGPNETLPMWGGVGITENIPLSTTDGSLGGIITRATNVTAAAAGELTGFVVSDQAYAWITTPQSTAPTAAPGMTVPYYRRGSGARIVVACAPSLINLDGSPVTQQVSWDFGGQALVPYVAAYAANVATASSWASTGNGQLTITTTSAHGVTVGSYVTLSGFTPAGYNGTFVAITGTTGSTLVLNAINGGTIANPGASTVQGQLNAGGGALPVRVLQTQAAGNKLIAFNSATGAASYVNSGAAALILL